MFYIKSFNQVTPAEYMSLGYSASDIIDLSGKGHNVPLGVVIKKDAFEKFLQENNLNQQFSTLQQTGQIDQLKQMITQATIPADFNEELKETFESLAIGEKESLFQIMPSSGEKENALNFRTHSIQNYNELVDSIKLSWLNGGSVLLLNQKDPDATVEAEVNSSNQIKLKAYYGEYDPTVQGEDNFTVGKEFLQIKDSHVVFQQSKLVREGNQLQRTPLTQEGSSQKVDDKIIMECARLSKKSFGILNSSLQIIYSVNGQEITTIACTRLKEEQSPGLNIELAAPAAPPEEVSETPAEQVEMESEVEEETTPEMPTEPDMLVKEAEQDNHELNPVEPTEDETNEVDDEYEEETDEGEDDSEEDEDYDEEDSEDGDDEESEIEPEEDSSDEFILPKKEGN